MVTSGRTALLVIGILTLATACAGGLPEGEVASHQKWLLDASFDSPGELVQWRVDSPADGLVSVNPVAADGRPNTELTIKSADGVVTLWRRIDASGLRGQRIRMTARVKSRKALVRAALVVRRVRGQSGIGDISESAETADRGWVAPQAVVDVAGDATDVEVKLTARGEGEVSLDEVKVASLGPTDATSIAASSLSARQQECLSVLGHVLLLVRYFYPSDDNANVEWDSVTIRAVTRVLAMRRASLIDVISDVLRPIAPLARVYEEGSPPPIASVDSEERATWWHHAGLAPAPVYLSFREGIDEPDTAGVIYAPVPVSALAGCRRAAASLKAEVLDAEMSAKLEMRLVRGGSREDALQEPLGAPGSITHLTQNVPDDIVRIQVGLRASGHGMAAASMLTFACDDRKPIVLDLGSAVKESEGIFSAGKWLYERGVQVCASGPCVYVRRSASQPEVRPIDVPIGTKLRFRMPVALPRTNERTRTVPSVSSTSTSSVWDQSTRLAAVLMAWGTLSHFYPYFGETRVDWSQELRPALDEASGARSPDEMYSALARLVAKLDDGHAQVVHAGRRMTGIVPLELRLVEGRLVVVGGLEPYLGAAPIGSEILSLEGVPAEQGYTRMAREVSAATDGYRSYVVPLFLTLGSVGGLRKFEVRGPDASVRELVVPLLPRKFKDQVREPRPKNGTQIDAGIFYIDVETIDSTTWRSLLSDLTKARGIVFDMRGYPSHTWTDVISNLTDKEISSPLFDIPLVRATGVIGYDRVWWTIRPNAPLLSRNVAFLVDGRAVSATETLLQMVRDHHLGILVGEPTAGTNGNLSSFTVPGGFEVNFTGMRALNLRGEVLHGRGIAPDLIVHPTLAGIRADRDEILEAALAQLRNREHGS